MEEVKEIKVLVIQKEQIDSDSIAMTLDFDGIVNVPTIMKIIDERLKVDNQVNIKDVMAVVLAIYGENKRRRRANK